MTLILLNKLRLYFQESFKRQIIIKFISIATPLNKLPLKNILKCLDTKSNFQEHLNNILSKVNETIGLLRELQAFLLRQSSGTLYNAFTRPDLNFGDIIYDQTYNESFHQKMESIQYKAALAITSAIRGTSRENLYQAL